jgi:hypothetical protein
MNISYLNTPDFSFFCDATKHIEQMIEYLQSHKSVFPLDAQLNLPSDQYSDGIRQRVAIEARKASYDEAIELVYERPYFFQLA